MSVINILGGNDLLASDSLDMRGVVRRAGRGIMYSTLPWILTKRASS